MKNLNLLMIIIYIDGLITHDHRGRPFRYCSKGQICQGLG